MWAWGNTKSLLPYYHQFFVSTTQTFFVIHFDYTFPTYLTPLNNAMSHYKPFLFLDITRLSERQDHPHHFLIYYSIILNFLCRWHAILNTNDGVMQEVPTTQTILCGVGFAVLRKTMSLQHNNSTVIFIAFLQSLHSNCSQQIIILFLFW